ncbi:recombinase family protein [uncultured Clostridium sp.]|uniref:recombinase family protein n=1 Tax=uncultured Clostridium sp. TaxID=59620 RepID=UPI0025F71E18|nr:recombinase family protein [uncultured Clostridium sp.]MDU4882961.1 recombinase family protein [Clostridium celatum]MDU7076138.1 recombinase family protein [Clostridium celatum]
MKIAIYSRKSKETDTGESIQNQINICKDYFNRQYNNCVFEIFYDEGFSGGNINRPDFQRFMQSIKLKKFDILGVYKIDRVSRNTLEFLTVFEELKQYNIKLVSVTEGFDPSTPGGKMMMDVLASMAEMERANIAQRVKDNMLGLAKMGRWSGGTPPTGYKPKAYINEFGKKEMYLELDEVESDIIYKIFNLSAAGCTTYAIGKEVNKNPKTILNILRNPVYCESNETSKKFLENMGYTIMGELNGNGYMTYNKRPRSNGKKIVSDYMLAVVSKHKAIVTAEMFIKANKNLTDRAPTKRPRKSQGTFLSHLVKCGKCGGGMFVASGNKLKDGSKKLYFRCTNQKYNKTCDAKWIRVDEIERFVLSELYKFSLDKNKLNEYINSNINLDCYDNDIKKLKSQVNKLNIDINNLTEKLLLLDGAAVKIVNDKINQISNERELKKEMLFELESKKIELTVNSINVDELYNNIKKLLVIFDLIPIDEQQILINQLITSIEISDNDKTLIF